MVSEFERRAWDNRTDADKHKPEMALKITLDDIERGKIDPCHVIVLFVERDGDGFEKIGYLQAGDLSEFAVEGAMLRATRIAADNRQ